MGDSFRQILADTVAEQTAAEPAPAPAPEPVAAESEPTPEPVVDAAPEQPAPEQPAPEAPVAEAPKQPWVSLSRHNAILREAKQKEQALAEIQQKYEQTEQRLREYEQRIAANMAAANPQIAQQTAKTADSDKDWIQQMLDAGAELPPEMVDNLRRVESKIKQQDETLQRLTAHYEQQAEAKAMSDFEQGLNRLQERCPQFSQEELLGMLQDGVKPSRIVGWYDQVHQRPSATPAAPARAAAPTPVPKIEGAPVRTSSAPTDDSVSSYLKWMREFTQH